MAVRLLQTHEVSDLCIGKPALRWLPPSSTVADAVAELEGWGPDAAVAVWDGEDGSAVAGRMRMVDVLLFLCADPNLASPAAALQASLSDLLAAGAPPVRRIEPDASVLEAVDALLDGAHALVVPVRERWRRRAGQLCWLTVDDVARFFLSSIGLFSPTASRSVSELRVVRPATLAVAAGDRALSAVPLLRAALASQASVPVVVGSSSPGQPPRLAGEISPSALCSCGVSAAAAIATLSAAHLVSFMDWGAALPPESVLHAVRSRLRHRGLLGMLDLLYGGSDPSSSSSSSSSASSSSDEDEGDERRRVASPCARRGKHGSARIAGRKPWAAQDTIVCRGESSLVAVMVQAVAHRVTHVWVLGEKHELTGIVRLIDLLRVLRHHQLHQPPI